MEVEEKCEYIGVGQSRNQEQYERTAKGRTEMRKERALVDFAQFFINDDMADKGSGCGLQRPLPGDPWLMKAWLREQRT